jgi:uncharacterized membrane protein
MSDNNPIVAMKTNGYPLYPMLAPFPVAFFLGAFVTDLVYWRVPDVMWETFSVWLITGGLVMAGFSVVAGLIDVMGHRRNVAPAHPWPRVLAIALAFMLAFLNAFVHSRDGYTAVVPTGLILSGLVAAILICSAWIGRQAVYHQHVVVVN